MSKSPQNTMSPAQIKAALEAGIITPAQAKTMQAKNSAPNINMNSTEAVFGNEDNMRFIRGFSDVFIALGLGLLSLGVWALFGLLGGGALYLGAAGVMWLASEYFGRKKRAHLPTLILALCFLLFVHKGANAILPSQISGIGLGAALITLIAMALYYMRFRLPFCIALIAISALILIFSFLRSFVPDFLAGNFGLCLTLSGLCTFILAMGYDMRDTHRQTRFADNAFWLHLTAAPLIIHGIALSTVMKTTRLEFGFLPTTDLDKPHALLVLCVISGLIIIGLAINRRAIIASSLGYAALALIFLIKDTGIGFGGTATTVLIIMGAGIMLLGIGWHSARKALLKILPRGGIFKDIFPPETYPKTK